MLKAFETARSGKFGSLRYFNSSFSQPVNYQNHRAKNGYWAGPVPDMGPYPINTARNLFGAEPLEVSAMGTRTEPQRFRDFDDQVAVNLRFPGGRIATMLLSYSGADLDDFRIVGTLGDLYSTPAFAMPGGFKHTITVGEKKSEESFRPTDQFGGELKYFSDCIQRNKHPEADGEEGSSRRPHNRRIRACAGVGTTCRSLIPMRVSCARQRVKHRSCTKLMNRNLSASISRATAADRRIDDASATS